MCSKPLGTNGFFFNSCNFCTCVGTCNYAILSSTKSAYNVQHHAVVCTCWVRTSVAASVILVALPACAALFVVRKPSPPYTVRSDSSCTSNTPPSRNVIPLTAAPKPSPLIVYLVASPIVCTSNVDWAPPPPRGLSLIVIVSLIA